MAKDDNQGGAGGSIHGGEDGKSGHVDATQSSAMPVAQGGVYGGRSHDGDDIWGTTNGKEPWEVEVEATA